MSFASAIATRQAGLCLYGLAPPKRSTPPDQLQRIAELQSSRLRGLPLDALVLYDIQDEADRSAEPRPFPFLPTLRPEDYAASYLADVPVAKIVYHSVGSDSAASLAQWLAQGLAQRLGDLDGGASGGGERAVVLVGAASSASRVQLSLSAAYDIKREAAPALPLGGITIAERHGQRFDEEQRIQKKMDRGCQFFISQAVYDPTATKSLISDLHLALQNRGQAAVPLILTFSPCASEKTLEFMKWLGISFPRWLENELRHATDPLATSLALCEQIFADVWQFAGEKGIPLGINVESVSTRKAEIDASVELLRTLRAHMVA